MKLKPSPYLEISSDVLVGWLVDVCVKEKRIDSKRIMWRSNEWEWFFSEFITKSKFVGYIRIRKLIGYLIGHCFCVNEWWMWCEDSLSRNWFGMIQNAIWQMIFLLTLFDCYYKLVFFVNNKLTEREGEEKKLWF